MARPRHISGYLRLRKIVLKRTTVVEFRVNNLGGNGRGCFRIKLRVDTAQFTNARIAGYGER